MMDNLSVSNDNKEESRVRGEDLDQGTADALYTAQTQQSLTTASIDKLLASPDLHLRAKEQLTCIKTLLSEGVSGSLREDILRIKDGRLMIDGYLLPVRRSVKQSLSFDNIAEQPSSIKSLLSFAAGLVGKKFVFTGRDALLKKEMDADTFVRAINTENAAVLAVLRPLFWFDYTIPLISAKNDKHIVLQIGSKGSRFHVLD